MTFFGFENDTALVYKNLDVVIVPSEIPDPLPRSVMEAMARGIPVLGYPAGGIPEMIVDQETGFLVKDGEAFLKALKALKDDPQMLSGMTAMARKKITQEFSLENLHTQITKLYSNVLAR